MALMVLIPLFVIVHDYRATRYGNGVFRHYVELTNGAHLTYLNGTSITLGRTSDYRAIVWPGSQLKTAEGDTLKITKVKRYAIGQDGLFLVVATPVERILVFTTREAVQMVEPSTIAAEPALTWYDLEDKPALVYYWRFIVYLLFLIEGALLVLMVVRYLRRLR